MSRRSKGEVFKGGPTTEGRWRRRHVYVNVTVIHAIALIIDIDEELGAEAALRKTYYNLPPTGWIGDNENIEWTLARDSTADFYGEELYFLTVITYSEEHHDNNTEVVH